jgi:hypothetical protein
MEQLILNTPTIDELRARKDMAFADIDKAAEQLINEAQGRYDYIARWLEKEFQVALGTDDQARQEFLKKVYSATEERIGRIPYDYEKYTNRQLEDYALSSGRLAEDTQKAMDIAKKDYDFLKQQQDAAQAQERQTQTENLLARGILTSERSEAQGVSGQAVGKLESAIGLENEMSQEEYDRKIAQIALNRLRGQEDLDITKTRGLADITDKYRREAQDATMTRDKEKEGAQLTLEQQKAQVNRDREREKRNVESMYGSF